MLGVWLGGHDMPLPGRYSLLAIAVGVVKAVSVRTAEANAGSDARLRDDDPLAVGAL